MRQDSPTEPRAAAGVAGGAEVRAVWEFSMSELTQRTGVPAPTVRYYLASGLLPPPRRAKANRFYYDERHVEVIRLIRLLQERRNLSLETIGRMLPELLPDLTGAEEGGVFRAEMWGQLLAMHLPSTPASSLGHRLAEAALTEFARRGYADVSVDDVCRAAGVAKGSFYRYFSSKEELFLSVVERAVEALGTRADALGTSGPADYVAGLADALDPYLAIVCDLASLAAQGRVGYADALCHLVARLAAVTGSGTPLSGDRVEIVERAIGRSLVRAAQVSATGADTRTAS